MVVQMFGKKVVFLMFDVSNKFEGILSFNHILNHFGGMERGGGKGIICFGQYICFLYFG